MTMSKIILFPISTRNLEDELSKIVSEHEHQARAFSWASDHTEDYPELDDLYALPLGGWRPKATCRRLKEEGVKAGLPDVCLPIPRNGYGALYLELKKPGGKRPSKVQQEWHRRLRLRGNRVEVVWSWADLILAALDYLGYNIPKEVVDATFYYRSRRRTYGKAA
jgi:hypothetical protein